MTTKRKVTKKTKQVGKYHFKRDAEIVTTNDPGMMFTYFKAHTFADAIDGAVELARGILKSAGLPDTPTWNVVDPESREVIGTVPLNFYVIEERGYDSGSLPGLSSTIISMAEQIKTAPSDLLLFDFGRHVERLHAVILWDGGKKTRLDALGKIMRKTMLLFVKDNGKLPSARQLWDMLPDKGSCVQERDEDDIYWKRSNGREEKTAFKSFQNRYTELKKKSDDIQ